MDLLTQRVLAGILDDNIKRDFFSSKSFIITGGAGFLGSWLSEVLCSLGSKVICIDNLSTSKMDNIKNLNELENFTFINEDITRTDLSSIGRCDFIFHLASRPSPEDYQQNPVESLLPNSVGTERLLQFCRQRNVPIAFASTSEVYGNPNIVPTPESYWGYVNPVGLRSCYDEGKRYAEALLMSYARQHGIPVKIFRIFNTYGPRLRADGTYGRALSRFLLQASKNEDVTIFGSGSQTRSFCYVTDTIRGILYVAQSDITNDVVNIGSPNEITILQLAEMIIETLESKSRIAFLPPAPDDPQRRCPDITKAKNYLGWFPKVDLKSGISMTIEWNKNGVC